MNVLFVKPRTHWCEDCCEGINRGLSPLFFQTAAFLRRNGIDLTVRQYEAFPHDLVTTHDCAVFVISLAGLQSQVPAIEAAKRAGLVTVVMLHDSFDLEADLMEEFACIDYCVLYPDRELGLLELLRAIAQQQPTPRSVLARVDGQVVRTPPRAEADTLHHLQSSVDEMARVLPDPSYSHAYMTVGRGCHYGCGFCDLRLTKNRNRLPEAVADEMAFIQRFPNLYAREPVSFIHPLFGGDLEWTSGLCEAMLHRDVAVPWRVTTHYQTVKPHVAPLWRRAGCAKVCLGLEHLNEPSLKPVNLTRFREAVAHLRSAGIQPMVSIIIGVWEDNDKVFSDLEDYIKTLGPVDVFATPFFPLRGTPLYEAYRQRGLIGDVTYRDYVAWGYDTVMLPTRELTKEAVASWKQRLSALTSGTTSAPEASPARATLAAVAHRVIHGVGKLLGRA